jgi:hypothetical protein
MTPIKSTTSRSKPVQRRRGFISRLLRVLKTGGDLRQRKIRRMRAALRAKRYEYDNDLKLSIALDRLIAHATEDVPVPVKLKMKPKGRKPRRTTTAPAEYAMALVHACPA